MPKHPGRLALRVEGDMWNAYWAPDMSSMKGSMLLGSIRLTLAEDNPALKNGFMEFMKIVMKVIIEDTTGLTISRWNKPRQAPDNERGGSA